MKEITVAQLRQNPTAALAEVEAGETYVVTKYRRPVARLVPVEAEPPVRIQAKNPGATKLADRPREGMRTYEETEALLREMKSALHNPGCSRGLNPPDSSSDLAM